MQVQGLFTSNHHTEYDANYLKSILLISIIIIITS